MIDTAKLKARIEDEHKDEELYHQMASECPDWSQVFCDIATEEGEHAAMLEHILEHMS